MTQLTINIKEKSFSATGKAEKHIAIKDLFFEQAENGFTCIVGPSGCGKTTLLNIIAELDTQFTGEIKLKTQNSNVNATSYVFQTPRLLPWRTVQENIALATNEPETSAESKAAITHILSNLGLDKFVNSYPHHLSLGMQRRAALARAFSVTAHVLLMDEPFVSLDQPTARKARELLLKLWHEQPRSILFVTHDLSEAIELADRILFLSPAPSRIIADVTVDIQRSERAANNIAEFKDRLIQNNKQLEPLI
ncbi:MAG: nitrate/sulfonate/bicarbonate ABC transporter ATP-binding protein [Cycloclasticus sp. symbiont of Poecilosclerida sp. M]|nr:MAG: nitrate/sulfonate/bicarbonate ABC transporter ATP-binding protein [Cycloclasticus sp. symbiont of Poecilosclerida sp. M]